MKMYKNYFKHRDGEIYCFATEDVEGATHYDGYFNTLEEAINDYKEAIDNYCIYYRTHQINSDGTGCYFDMEDYLYQQEIEEEIDAIAEREHERSYHPCYRN